MNAKSVLASISTAPQMVGPVPASKKAELDVALDALLAK
jgi:hypothetical protein